MSTADPVSPLQSLDIPVHGMTCAACVRRVTTALERAPGVTKAEVNLATGRATVTLDPAAATPRNLIDAVESRGFDVPQRVFAIRLGPIATSADPRIVEALGALPALVSWQGDPADPHSLSVRALADALDEIDIEDALRAAGVEVPEGDDAPPHGDEPHPVADADGLRRNVLVAAGLTVPVVALAMGPMLVPPWANALGGHEVMTALNPWMAGLTLPILLGPARPMLSEGTRALAQRAPDMNSLVLLGVGAATLYSLAVTLAPGAFDARDAHVYYESAAVVVTLVLLGRWLEQRARARTGAAIRALVALVPPQAVVVRGGREIERPVRRLRPSDLVRVRPGARLPVDGVVVDGESWIDASMLSGEPNPVAALPGTNVSAGTVNQTGSLLVRATAVGRDTQPARIIALVERAQTGRPQVQRLADKIVAVFVPIVIAVAALTFAGRLLAGQGLAQATLFAVSVLVIACPCAMGLATPISVMVGTGRAAQLGVLFRQGAAIETLAQIDTVAFDKTGTLTEGRPSVLSVRSLDPECREDDVLAFAAGVEAHSEHPLARAICQEAERRGVVAVLTRSFVAHVGLGARAWTRDATARAVQVGRPSWVAPHLGPKDLSGDAAATAVVVAVDDRAVGVICLGDALRPDAAATVADLRASGLQLALLSGDHLAAVQAVADQLGIPQVAAGCLPDDKARWVVDAQERGRRVAFVGDGINDAPVLAQAHVGVAMGGGTDIAIESAEVVLLHGHLHAFAAGLRVARATMRNIRWNLGWAYGYSVVLIPLAAGWLTALSPTLRLNPMLAGAAMSVSSLLVVTNALRLRRA